MDDAIFYGVMTAIATPFCADGSLDAPAFTRLLRSQKNAGIHGVVVCGTTGESPTLTGAERAQLIEMALAERTAHFRIYVGTGTNSTAETISLCKSALAQTGNSGQGVDGLMVVVPYYNKPSQSSLVAHFQAVCAAVGGAPVCVYNVPGRTGVALLPSTFLQIATSCKNVRAIKEAAGSVAVIGELARALRDAHMENRVALLTGDDPTFAPALVAGAVGVISVSTHIVPQAMLGIWNAWRENDIQKMTQIHLNVLELHDALFCAANPIPLKWYLNALGFCENELRLPLVPVDEHLIVRLRDALSLAESRGVALCRFAAK